MEGDPGLVVGWKLTLKLYGKNNIVDKTCVGGIVLNCFGVKLAKSPRLISSVVINPTSCLIVLVQFGVHLSS